MCVTIGPSEAGSSAGVPSSAWYPRRPWPATSSRISRPRARGIPVPHDGPRAKPATMPKRPPRRILPPTLAPIFLGGPSLVRFYTDWLWFGEVGYQFVFATMLRSQGTLFTITFAVTVVWLVANLRVAVGSVRD